MTNNDSKNFYITTTLPYVNSTPHIGFAMEIIRADVIARYKASIGYNVYFNTGTDEHGQKIYDKAKEGGIDVKKYVDDAASKFKDLLKTVGIETSINFIRTTDENHVEAAQEFWKICDKNGFIYKKNYKIKYCVGCELEKTESELVDGKCPLHPNLEIEFIDEENYFFKFSAFQEKLLKFYEENPKFVIPESRFNEIRSFVSHGLQDFSISRLKSKMAWGVPVPGDENHVMYVWFDALVSYISAIGWPNDSEKFKKWQVETGGMVQYCGKDNLRQQSAMWQAMLMAANLPNSKTIVIDGFVTAAHGIKMSKSLGNSIDPTDIVNEYGADTLRYYVLRELSPFEDTPCTLESIKDSYNADLANGLGNLVSRVMTMAQNNLEKPIENLEGVRLGEFFKKAIEEYNLQEAMNFIWIKIGNADLKIQTTEPFKLIKSDKFKAKEIIEELVREVYEIAVYLESFMPETSAKIKVLVKENKKPENPLFVRKM